MDEMTDKKARLMVLKRIWKTLDEKEKNAWSDIFDIKRREYKKKTGIVLSAEEVLGDGHCDDIIDSMINLYEKRL